MSAPKFSINIFDYVEYRIFLQDYYAKQKTENPNFSHRFIAKQLRANSTGWFSDIVKGRTNLSGNYTARLIKLMSLGREEGEYFEALVRFDQAGSIEEKNLHYKRILGFKGVKPELVGKEGFEYYSEWYHSVIRELLFFYRFNGDYAALGKKLHPPIGLTEAKNSIKLLERLGFIYKEASGNFKPVSVSLKKDPTFRSLHLANFLKAHSTLGIESLNQFPKEERDISAMTLSLSEEAFQTAKEEIRALRTRLLALTKTDENPDRVFQCNFHMFPVTR